MFLFKLLKEVGRVVNIFRTISAKNTVRIKMFGTQILSLLFEEIRQVYQLGLD